MWRSERSERERGCYLCPSSWAMVKAVARPISSLILHLLSGLQAPLNSAMPAGNSTCSLMPNSAHTHTGGHPLINIQRMSWEAARKRCCVSYHKFNLVANCLRLTLTNGLVHLA